jgi:hypothetical protein
MAFALDFFTVVIKSVGNEQGYGGDRAGRRRQALRIAKNNKRLKTTR